MHTIHNKSRSAKPRPATDLSITQTVEPKRSASTIATEDSAIRSLFAEAESEPSSIWTAAADASEVGEGASVIVLIPLASISLEESPQVRAAVVRDTVEEYTEALARGAFFPPVVVFQHGEKRWLADGFHRVAAYSAAGRHEILAHLKPGLRKDALQYALGANSRHGLRMSNADKRHAVTLALSEYGELSSRAIADLCGVNHQLVESVRSDDNVDESSTSIKRTGLDGKVYSTRKNKGQTSKSASRSPQRDVLAVTVPKGNAPADEHASQGDLEAGSAEEPPETADIPARVIAGAAGASPRTKGPLPPALPTTPKGQITDELLRHAVSYMTMKNHRKPEALRLNQSQTVIGAELAAEFARSINERLAAPGMGQAAIGHAASIIIRAAGRAGAAT